LNLAKKNGKNVTEQTPQDGAANQSAPKTGGLTRRQFITTATVAGAGVALSVAACSSPLEVMTSTATVTDTTTVTPPPATIIKEVPFKAAASQGYLLVDHVKCAGCLNCMMACSMAHEGTPNLSLSRIQVVQSSFDIFPNDLRQYECRQCATPVCVQNCPVGACYVDTANGNVRVIDQAKCVGCQTCINSCPQTPHRTIWNPVTKKASKCDLCINTPYLGEKGGPGGTQACVAVCPMQAIKFTATMPNQQGDVGYDVNLRNANAEKLLILDSPKSNK
jgi:protein NrfC